MSQLSRSRWSLDQTQSVPVAALRFLCLLSLLGFISVCMLSSLSSSHWSVKIVGGAFLFTWRICWAMNVNVLLISWWLQIKLHVIILSYWQWSTYTTLLSVNNKEIQFRNRKNSYKQMFENIFSKTWISSVWTRDWPNWYWSAKFPAEILENPSDSGNFFEVLKEKQSSSEYQPINLWANEAEDFIT